MEIGGLQKTTLIDFPGRIACTVFLLNCNFRCPFCYSPELVLQDRIKLQPRISEKDFFSFLEGKKGLLEGVVVCGGEPTCSKDLPEFLSKIKKLGFLVKLDTNGSTPKILRELIEGRKKSIAKKDSLSSLTSLPQSGSSLVDYVAMDIKAPKEKYEKAVGVNVNVKDIEESIKLLKESKVDYEFRTTVIPSLHSKEDILEIAKWLSPAKNYYLQNFRAEKTINPDFERIKPYSREFLLEIGKEISPYFDNCGVR